MRQEPEVIDDWNKGSGHLGLMYFLCTVKGLWALRVGSRGGSTQVRLALGSGSGPCPHCIFSLPFCSGLGYVLGSVVTDLTEDWRWALRVSLASFSSLCFPPG